jgi:acetyl-CoA carboxylase carboxyl transferase beta subunit/acetyl-CoA carboxylase carboxyl transferase alpha subunit
MRPEIARLASAFDEQDADLAGGDPLGFEGYSEQIERARAESGAREACVWGWATIAGAECALVTMDFTFLGGSMGVAVGEKVARAFDAARERKLPVVTVTASGGARMQEGMVALVQMAKTAEARREHADAGLAQVTLLTSPTTGGVYASFASLADVVIASPDATIGFAGPRVVEDLTGQRPDPRIHKAEFAFEHGLIDAIVPEADQRATIQRVLRCLDPSDTGPSQSSRTQGWLSVGDPAASADAPARGAALTAWQRLTLAREPRRPKARQILDTLLSTSFELRGDRTGASDDGTIVVRAGTLQGTARSVMVVAQDASGDARIKPAGFRKAIRAIQIAGRLGLPVITLIDTRGADPLPSSEGHGIAAAIAQTYVGLLACPSPTLAVIVGEGGSGGALAMAVCDRVIAWGNAVFSVIAPEGAASILYRDVSRSPELADRLGITAEDLEELGIVDEIVPEPPGGAHTAPALAAEDLSMRIASSLERLAGMGARKRLRGRHRRWRDAGNEWIRGL